MAVKINIEEAANLYQSGMTLRAVAKVLGAHRESIRERFVKKGIPLRCNRSPNAVPRDRDTSKVAAHNAVQTAIDNKTIVRQRKCEACGGRRNVVAHHADYNKPLDVNWLCRKCHGAWHEKFVAIEKSNPSAAGRRR